MAQTYKEIQRQIEQLQREAEALRSTEIRGVIDRIKVAIAHYGLTPEQLGIGGSKVIGRSKKTSRSSGKSVAKFGDGNGKVWSGRGPRPIWLREALASGRSINEFRVGTSNQSKSISTAPSSSEAATSATASASKTTKRAPSKLHYSDNAGNTWTGRGPKPKWLKALLDAGRSLEELTT